MINDELFEVLLKKCREVKSKVIFVGDLKQLSPINSSGYSKVFSLSNIITLNKIYRQSEDSGLVNILPILRERPIEHFETIRGLEGSVICHNDIRNFFKDVIPRFRSAIKNADILECKILAYTNNRVNALNLKTKELLFDSDNEYNKFEFLTGYENLEFNMFNFWNSMDYIIIDEPEKIDISIPNFMKLPGYKLNLYDSSSKNSGEINIISRNINPDYLNSLSALIEITRIEAIELKQRKSRGSSLKWKEYYKLIESFTTPIDLIYNNRVIRRKSFDYGYALSIHKSQGSTINNVFIDMKNVLSCKNEEALRQLQYVGISRTKNNIYLYQ